MSDTPDNPTPEPSEVDALKAQVAENWDKFLRATADFDNYRKRIIRERDELIRREREAVIAALLPALDNLERALEHSPADTPLHEGLLQVQKQFSTVLGEFGLTEMIAKPGDPFDPAVHEAISQLPSTEHPDGAIIEQVQSAYKLDDRLLRPARVVVSQGAPPAKS